jgi:hypothetical protein
MRTNGLPQLDVFTPALQMLALIDDFVYLIEKPI